MGAGRRPLARGSAGGWGWGTGYLEPAPISSVCIGHIGAEVFGQMGRPRSGTAGNSGRHLEWKACDLGFSLALLRGLGSVTAPLWDSVFTSEKMRGVNCMSSKVCVF